MQPARPRAAAAVTGMEQPILAAGQTRDLDLDGVLYTLRALTYAEVSAVQTAALRRPQPNDAVLADAIQRACEARGRQDLAQACARHEAAQDALSAIYASRPSRDDAAGIAQWMKERGPELEAAQREEMAAQRQRSVALHVAHDDPGVVALRLQLVEFVTADVLAIVAKGLLAVNGAPWSGGEDGAADLPSAHVSALSRLLREMCSPTESAVKN